MFQLFSCRKGAEIYSVVIEDEREDAEKNLRTIFDDVKFFESVPLDAPRTEWDGTRRFGNGIFKSCNFVCMFTPRRGTPLKEVNGDENRESA